MGKDNLTIFLFAFIFLWITAGFIMGTGTIEPTELAEGGTWVVVKNLLGNIGSFTIMLEIGGQHIGAYIVAFLTVLGIYAVWRSTAISGG